VANGIYGVYRIPSYLKLPKSDLLVGYSADLDYPLAVADSGAVLAWTASESTL
jgi:hypothetical protein